MIVCIAEKPSVAQDIARILGAHTRKQGYMEGGGYQVTWTFGHLCELKAPGDYTAEWQTWRLESLPMVPPRFGIRLKDDEGVKKQFAVIKQLMQAADSIINCGDAGQEGELIQRWVMQKAGARCPVQRLWISSMTDEAIRQGFASLKSQQEYDRLYMAGLSRAIGDWLLGMNCTRLYTLRYGQNRQVLSIGRVQTPTLALVVKRQREIDQFKSEPYWVLSTTYRDTLFTSTKGNFATEADGTAALSLVEGKPFTVTGITEKSGSDNPPRLYDLTSLQVDCNRQFGFSAQQTLQLIQSLYEKKLTTYPRVDTTFLPEDVYPQCPTILQGLKGYESFTQPLLTKPLPKTKKVFDTSKVTDHHAIIPTGQAPQYLSDMEQKVYDLIARTFIAAFYPPCKYQTTAVLGKVEDIEFKATGKRITSPGWRTLFPPKQSDEGESVLPTFTKGESGPHTPSLTRKETQPPQHYTEASLLRAMETAGKMVEDETLRDALKENGIGRPSTRAAIIETLYKRQYIRKERKHIVATCTGMELIDLIHEDLLKSAELTGQWEKKLREIERGQYDPRQFIDELKAMLAQIIGQVTADRTNRRITLMPEPKPGEKGKQAPRHAGASPAAAPPADETLRNVAGFQPKEKSTKTKTRAKKAKASPTPTANGPTDDWIGLPCPVCHKGTIIKGHTAYGCSRYKEGCNYRMPFVPTQAPSAQ